MHTESQEQVWEAEHLEGRSNTLSDTWVEKEATSKVWLSSGYWSILYIVLESVVCQ